MQKQIEQTISSIEVAKMVGKQHKNLLADIRGYMEELSLLENQGTNSRLKIQPRDFFRESTYTSRGREYLCYDVTKRGCEFIANKLTGIKGTEFTAIYINRFHDMEDTIKDGIPQKETMGANHKVKIPSPVNTAAKILKDTYTEAGVDPKFIAVAVNNLYKESTGYDSGIPLLTEEGHLYDKTAIAEEFGICSKSGIPHPQAVGAIINQLEITEDECVNAPYNRNGHSGVDVQYKESVCDKVAGWLYLHDYPEEIISENGKKLKVVYK